MNDWELIQKYCNGSESAFEALVKRHVDYVYCAALRQVRDPALAEDVSQAVFMLLAQKAKTFRPGTILVSWLFRTTQNIAARAVRSELRRQRRESEAATMNPTTFESDPQWERVAPVLDEALATLPTKDRDAILLRFIGRKQFSEVGAQIGASEDAAKKRVTRALGRLREFFLRRGTTLTVAAIGVMLGEHVVHAAPVALPAKISAGVLSAGAASTSAATLLNATLRDLFWNKVKWGAALGAGVVAVLLLGTAAMRQHSRHEFATAGPPPVIQRGAASDSKTAADGNTAASTNAPEHTLSLLILRSEDHQPVAGTHVLADAWTSKGMRHVLDAHTDARGTLNIAVPPLDTFGILRIWVSAENHVPMVLNWEDHEFNEPVLSHTVSLDPGRVVEGTVLDEFGAPIPGAKISFTGPGIDPGKRDNYAFNPDLSSVLTDVNGHWTSTQYPANRDVGLRADSPNYVSVRTWRGDLTGFPTNVLMHMSNGVALTGRIISTNGTPIAKAGVTKQNGSAYLYVRTDANGVFHLPHIERGQTIIDVSADGFENIQSGIAWATNDVNECTFTMIPAASTASPSSQKNTSPVTLQGTVVDADTGTPIPAFGVLLGTQSLIRNDASLTDRHLIGEGRDGHFEWQMPRGGGFRLEIDADGYLAAVSELRNYDNAGDPFTFKLQRATVLVGHVLTPDGSPAKNAVVSLTGAGIGPTMQSPGQLLEPNPGFEDSRTRTDDNGNFRLTTKTGAHGVAIVHETGTALLTYEAATNAPITLQRWGTVEGILYLNGQPAPNQTVAISGTEKVESDPKIMFSFDYMATTDANGKFHFDKALPGKHRVEREVSCPQGSSGPAIINPDQTAEIEVKPGAVATVDLRRDGRPVIGRLIVHGATNEIDWGMSQGLLDGTHKFPFALSKDGTIRAEDVPPGTYKLSISLALATAEPVGFGKTFGTLEKQVVISPSENESHPVDLGSMTITQGK